MSDLISVGSSGVLAYQRALLVTSNNIANVATDGYSRQEVALETSSPQPLGTGYVGTGVSTGNVTRQYNEFIESNLRRSQSELSGQGPLVEYTNRVIDLMAGENTGMTGVLGDFFNAARDLAVNPASTVYRSAFLRSADGVAAGFRQLTTQLESINAETEQSLKVTLEEVNTLSSQLVAVNKQLSRNGNLDQQAPDLLDQRDRLLRDLAAKIEFKAGYKRNGEVIVSLSSSLDTGVIVNGTERHTVGMITDAATGQVGLFIDPYNSTKTPITSPSGGGVGGLLAFREQVLRPAQQKLDFLAQTLADEVNAIHQSGVDSNGEAGAALFTFNAGVSAAAGITLAISDPLKVAAAGPFRVYGDELNVGTALATVDFNAPTWDEPPALNSLLPYSNAHEDYSYSKTITGDAVVLTAIPQGTTQSVVYLDPADGQSLQLITRDGRQLLGTSLTQPQADNVVNLAGFTPGATFSSAYLNQTGTNAYLGLDYFIGAQAEPVTNPLFHPNSGEPVSTATESSRLVSGRISATTALAAGDFNLNGVALGALTAGGDAKAVATWINVKASTTGLTARAFNTITLEPGTMDFSTGSSANFTLNTLNTPATDPATITGYTDLDSLVEKINAANTGANATGVTASINNIGQLILSSDGRTIEIGANTFMSASGTFGGQVEIIPTETRVNIALADLTLTEGATLTLATGAEGNASTVNLAIPNEWIDAVANAATEAEKTELLQIKLVEAINAQSYFSHVQAQIVGTNLVLSNAPGFEGQFIALSGTTASGKAGTYSNASAATALTGDASTWGDDTPTIRLGFGTGTASELKALGFRTGAYVTGAAPEDLLVVVTDSGNGTAKLTAEYTLNSVNQQEALRALPFTVTFQTDGTYTLAAEDGTELAKRTFDATNPVIAYRGLTFTFSDTPASGDKFYFDGNLDGLGNNETIMRIVDLETDTRLIPGGYTLSELYLEQTGQVANVARQATIAKDALTVVNQQAAEARDRAVGVSLDQEAADLIRFQQAYQASAKVIQISSDLFNTILQSAR